MAATSTDLTPWNDLQASLAGSFGARARGIISVEYALTDRNGREFGRLRENGAAELDAGALQATIRRTAKHEYRVLLRGGAEVLTAAPIRGTADALAVRCAGRRYEARLSLLRNTAVATDESGTQIARLSGSLAGRRYEAVFEPNVEGALPVAVLLLHHATTARTRAYRT